MPLNKHVMKTEFRLGLTKVYRDALIAAGVGADSAEIAPHIIGTATVKLTDAQLHKLRAHYGDKLEELTSHTNSMKIEILLPQAVDYLSKNRPTLTEEERAAKKSKGTGARGISEEERARREASRQRMEKILMERYGVDLSENRAESSELPDDDDTDTDADADTSDTE